MTAGLLSIAVVFFAIACIAGSIPKINGRRGTNGKTTIGFGSRGTGVYSSQSDVVENFAYAQPVFGWTCLGVAVLCLVVAVTTRATPDVPDSTGVCPPVRINRSGFGYPSVSSPPPRRPTGRSPGISVTDDPGRSSHDAAREPPRVSRGLGAL